MKFFSTSTAKRILNNGDLSPAFVSSFSFVVVMSAPFLSPDDAVTEL